MIRTKDYEVWFFHTPAFQRHNEVIPYPRTTVCRVVACSPFILDGGIGVHIQESQNFCKESNRKEALTKAIKHLPRSERSQIWKAYFDRNTNQQSYTRQTRELQE